MHAFYGVKWIVHVHIKRVGGELPVEIMFVHCCIAFGVEEGAFSCRKTVQRYEKVTRKTSILALTALLTALPALLTALLMQKRTFFDIMGIKKASQDL